jgi:dTDP-glucose 4,6-dehydratase
VSQLGRDLEEILSVSEIDLHSIVNKSVLMTGGTGFVGSWLTESWNHACRRLKGKGRLTILSRDPKAFEDEHNLDSGQVGFVSGDVRSFRIPPGTKFDLIVHAATPARATLNNNRPAEMLDIILGGQENLLNQISTGSSPRLVFTSSGAVYGPQPATVQRISEEQLTGPDVLNPHAAYHEGKRMAEMLLSIAASEGIVQPLIARLFAFHGPFLPLNEHFAIGNFIRDALAGGPIVVNGDGTTVRSYQYPTDMVSWLWAIAERAHACHAFNVGSDEGMSMREIAQTVASVSGVADVDVRGTPDPTRDVDRYIPSINRATTELGLINRVPFTEGLRRTLVWHKEKK